MREVTRESHSSSLCSLCRSFADFRNRLALASSLRYVALLQGVRACLLRLWVVTSARHPLKNLDTREHHWLLLCSTWKIPESII